MGVVTSEQIAGCDIHGAPITPWVDAVRRGMLGSLEAPAITVDAEMLVYGVVCSDGSRFMFPYPKHMVPKDSLRTHGRVGEKAPG